MKTKSRVLRVDDFNSGLVSMAPGEETRGLLAVKDLYADPSGRGLRLMDGGTDQTNTWAGAASNTTATFMEILDWQTVDAIQLVRGQNKLWETTPGSSSTDISAGLLGSGIYTAHMVAGVSDGVATQSVGIFSNEGWTWGGGGNISSWTATLGTIPSNGRPICWTNNRMYGLDSTNLSRVVWSDLFDANSWPTDNFVQIGVGSDGELITAIHPLGPYLLVFRYNSIYTIYDLDTGANRMMTDSVGTVDWRTVCSSPMGVFFKGNDGIVYLTNGTSVQAISRKIADVVDDNNQNAAVGKSSVGFYHDDWYELSLWTGTTWTRHLRYHIPTQTWWEQSVHATNGNAPSSYSRQMNKQNKIWALYPDAGSGKPAIMRQMFDPTSYDGLSPMVQLPYLNFAGPLPRSRVRSVNVRTGFTGSHDLTMKDSDGSTLWTRSVSPTNHQARIFGLGPDGLTRGGSLEITFPSPTAVPDPTTSVLDSVEFEIAGRAD